VNFINNIKRIWIVFLAFILFTPIVYAAESASINFSINIPPYMEIQTVTNSVLTAHITDDTGNLYSPLQSRFKIISNQVDDQTLYLKANTITDNGYESALFERGGVVYIAFSNIEKKPTSEALANCKYGARAKESPGVVAYPIIGIYGAKSKYKAEKNKYELYVKNGVTDILVNVGQNVLKSSFASNDPKGFYQATLSITEADI